MRRAKVDHEPSIPPQFSSGAKDLGAGIVAFSDARLPNDAPRACDTVKARSALGRHRTSRNKGAMTALLHHDRDAE